MLGSVLCIVGLVIFPISIWAWFVNCRLAISTTAVLWRRVWRWSWVAGFALAVATIFVWYPVDGGGDRYRMFGIPFMAYAFDSNGFDYVSCLSLPAAVLNFVFWCFFPQLVMCIWARTVFRKPGAV